MKTLYTTSIAFVLLVVLNNPLFSQEQEWARYRGPNGRGISNVVDLPATWTAKDFLWTLKLPGRGHSSPIIWGKTVYATSANKENTTGYLYAINAATGEVRWKKEFPIFSDELNNSNSLATSTPCADADHVYSLWYSDESVFLLAFDHNGNQVWKSEFEGVFTRHGAGSSPIVFDNAVVFTREQELNGPYKSTWVAVERQTGKTRWELERKTVTSNSFAAPVIYNSNPESPELLFMSESHGMTIVNVHTGKVVWEEMITNARAISTPQLVDDLLIGTCKGLEFVIRIDKANKILETLYEKKRNQAPYLPTPLIKDGLLYNALDNGNIICLDLLTGNEIWKEKPAGQIYGSPIWADGKIYVISKNGEVIVINPGKSGGVSSVIPLGENSQCTPASANGRIIFKTESQLFALGKK